MALPAVQVVSYHVDPLELLADRVLTEQADHLPLLTGALVLLPDMQAAPRLRRLLTEKARSLGHEALLGPHIMTLKEWVGNEPVSGSRVVGELSRELILVDALREHHSLFGEANPWTLADSLLKLFDELTMHKVGLPDNLDHYIQLIAEGYGGEAGNKEAMDREARLVHTLWRAWHQQLEAGDMVDRTATYLINLAMRQEQPANEKLYLAGYSRFSAAEYEWLASGLEQGKITLFLQGDPDSVAADAYHPDAPIAELLQQLDASPEAKEPDEPFARFMREVYCPNLDERSPIAERAQAFSSKVAEDPVVDRLKVLHAMGNEDEAVAVEIQVRRWLLEGRQNIAIVTENRRLARRVRALLERARIVLQDSAGWALSTTSAAATLERWLQCIEEDFPHLPLLDLLKSPFFCSNAKRDDHLVDVYRLEQDIILHENVGAGLERYRFALNARRRRAPDFMAPSFARIETLLLHLEQAAARLVALTDGKLRPPAEFLDGLQQSLDSLEMNQTLAADAAGNRLLEVIGEMAASLTTDLQAMNWTEFRTWLGRSLERHNFRPSPSGDQVQLMGLGQSVLGRYDGLIIAGVEREFLPGSNSISPFFNDAVRHSLGLPTSHQQMTERFHHFRRLLEAAPEVLLTLRREQDGEEILPCPWLENLITFHQLAYDSDLENRELARLSRESWTRIVTADQALPKPEVRPAPLAQAGLLPRTLSASSYQQLLDCPYQFFAARCLGLSPAEEIKEALEKADYGQKVHRCLEAFHAGVSGLPGPFKGNFSQTRRHEAIDLLESIARAEFALDIEDNFLHRDWLARWQRLIPDYVDWQIARSERWWVKAVEQNIEQETTLPGVTLKGRLDRIDEESEGLAIVDYKTGSTPKWDEVVAGESIQLPFYHLLAGEQPVKRVEYLSLNNEVKTRLALEDDELQLLSSEVAKRLAKMEQQLKANAPLPAWGDENCCKYCPLEGICRRQTWLEDKREN